jgi:predicted transposase YdaD
MKNDVSFIIEDTISLYEQQSTYCPNMPLRFLMYLAKLYEGYSQREKFYIYSSTLQRIPKPKCVCFYNGKDKKEDRKILRLSDMYFENTKLEKEIECIVELEVIMVNINYGYNKELLEKCTPLYEYSFFVDRIRFHIDKFEEDGKNYTLEEAIDKAIEELPKDFKILPFILKNRLEVKDMCLFEYDEEKHIEGEKAYAEAKGRAEGREEGREEGKEENMLELVHEGLLDKTVAAKKLGITLAQLEEKLKAMFG